MKQPTKPLKIKMPFNLGHAELFAQPFTQDREARVTLSWPTSPWELRHFHENMTSQCPKRMRCKGALCEVIHFTPTAPAAAQRFAYGRWLHLVKEIILPGRGDEVICSISL